MAETIGTVAASLQLVAVLKAAINVGLEVRNAPKEQQDLAREVGGLEPLLTQLQGRLRDNLFAGGIRQLTEPLKRLRLILEQMVNKLAAANKPGMKGPKALAWTLWNKKEMYEVLGEVERFKALLNLGLTMDIWDVAQQQQNGHDPGAGKTVLSSVVVDHLRTSFSGTDVGVACAYLNHKETGAQSPANILAGLWRQIIFQKAISADSPTHELYVKHHEQRTRPSADEMHTVLCSALEECPKVYIAIDALDEYPEQQVAQQYILLKYLAALGPNINLMLTSQPHITPNIFFPNIRGSTRLSKHVQSRPELCQEIETTITSNADGMFLLAKLHTDSLTTKVTIKAVREALKNLPKDLEHTYNEAMARIDSQSEDERNIAYLALIWVANAKRPLSAAELQEAIAVEVSSKSLDPDGILDITLIVSVCAGLLMIDVATGLLLIEKGADIHAQTRNYGNTPQAASSGGHEALVCLLIEMGAEIHAESRLYGNALQAASAGGHGSLVHLLIEKGADINAQGGHFGNILQAASYHGHESLVHLLIEKGANVNIQGGHYGNALQAASCSGKESLVNLLIEKGADINVQGGHYGNALQAALCGGKESLIHLLIEKGADINAAISMHFV
ncbi:hypothetical protein C8J57DRAFT_1568954 [Mycena rebaudengoi]|nr:hypothetical protein C8J57DRAFT_1568954 [Mycena rebaudengoi]